MDVKQFLDSRNSTFDAFMKKYDYLKSEYSKALSSAITETDTQTREKQIPHIQSLNTELSQELRDILTEVSKGVDTFNPTTIDQLTQQLIQYQKDHQALDQSQDKLKTLKMIKYTSQSRLKEVTTMYGIYVLLLCVFSVLVVILVMRSTISKTVAAVIQTATPR
jgi:t-SNARE complex subunit (syntaxin)